jgi:hypothetical protein
MKNKLLITLTIIAILTGLYFAFRKKINVWIAQQKSKLFGDSTNITSNVPQTFAMANGATNEPLPATNTGYKPIKGIDENKILKRGMNCPEVAELQKLLNKYVGYVFLSPIAIVNNFGPKTEAALLKIGGKPSITLAEAYTLFAQNFPQASMQNQTVINKNNVPTGLLNAFKI